VREFRFHATWLVGGNPHTFLCIVEESSKARATVRAREIFHMQQSGTEGRVPSDWVTLDEVVAL